MNDWFLYGVLALLPIAAYSGYRLGRKQRKEQKSSNGSLSSNYIKGLNYLLNEQADKAVDTFIDLLTVDTDTVETHLALGNLFRKRGEVDRAIRLHQNLIARPQLKTEDRNTALYQLGLDYNAVGMYDRAVSLFNELLSDPEHKSESLHQLLNIYQLTKDWDQAAKIAEQLQSSLGEEQSKPLAHFYCELADQKQIEGDIKAALANLKKLYRSILTRLEPVSCKVIFTYNKVILSRQLRHISEFSSRISLFCQKHCQKSQKRIMLNTT